MTNKEFIEDFCKDLVPLPAMEVVKYFAMTGLQRMDTFHRAVEKQIKLDELNELLDKYSIIAVTALCMDMSDIVLPMFGPEKAADLFIKILKVTPFMEEMSKKGRKDSVN